MTKKDYEALAHVLHNWRKSCDRLPIIEYRALLEMLASWLADDNARFDRDRFYRACGF